MPHPTTHAGRILHVNLSSRTSELVDTSQYIERFLGGRGVASAIYWNEVPPEARFDDEDNRCILSLGPLSGIQSGLGGSRWGIFGKSPFPAPSHGGRDHLCYGNLGGTFGAELRFAGYDGIVVHGKAESPVSIEIQDDVVEVKPADDLWGRTTVETMDILKTRTAPKTKVLAIGPAGEHLVPLATVFADGDASCSGGMGAVMGSKNLKAIAVRGTQRNVPIADRETLRSIERQIRSCERGNVKVWGLDFMAHGPKTRKYSCHGCMGHCLRVRYTTDSGQSGKFMCQSRFFYMNHAWGFYGEDTDVPFLANRLCDEYGIDTWEVQSLIEWLLLCHAQGIITEKESGLDLDTVGSLDFIENLVRMTSHRQGFGELLSQGAFGASRARGGPAEGLFTRTDPYDPRYCTVNTLLFPFETREPIQQLHEAGLVLSQWSSWAKGIEDAHISSDVLRGIAVRFWGSVKAADMTTLDGKAEAARRIQNRQLAKESMGVCDWMFPLIDVPKGDDHVGDPSFESRILSAVLGVTYSENDLYEIGERVFNLQRAILLREGHHARTDDFLPREWHERSIETHVADPDLLAPDSDGKIVSQIGRRADLPEYLRIRDEYYQLRGWDVPTGLPAREGLEAIDLGDVGLDLLLRGLAVQRARPVPLAARFEHGLSVVRGRLLRMRRAPSPPSSANGTSISGDALMAILVADQQKFGHESIAHNFKGWNKTMQYSFPDIGEYYRIRFEDGRAHPPEKLDSPERNPEISYEMDTWTLEAMSKGEITGEQAYLKRKLKIKASFVDMMKLQSLNSVSAP